MQAREVTAPLGDPASVAAGLPDPDEPKPLTARAIVDFLGGEDAVASGLSRLSPGNAISPEGVRKWKTRGAIPPKWHHPLVRLAQELGKHLTHDDLAGLGA